VVKRDDVTWNELEVLQVDSVWIRFVSEIWDLVTHQLLELPYSISSVESIAAGLTLL
jgi:hypothetical protein